jgi:hypothetical protein
VYYVPFKWQLDSSAPTSDFRMAVTENAKKKNGHFTVSEGVKFKCYVVL